MSDAQSQAWKASQEDQVLIWSPRTLLEGPVTFTFSDNSKIELPSDEIEGVHRSLVTQCGIAHCNKLYTVSDGIVNIVSLHSGAPIRSFAVHEKHRESFIRALKGTMERMDRESANKASADQREALDEKKEPRSVKVRPGPQMTEFMQVSPPAKRDTLHLDLFGRVNELRSHAANNLEVMRSYLESAISREDWHGVEDAASDIRDLLAEIKAYDNVLKLLSR